MPRACELAVAWRNAVRQLAVAWRLGLDNSAVAWRNSVRQLAVAWRLLTQYEMLLSGVPSRLRFRGHSP